MTSDPFFACLPKLWFTQAKLCIVGLDYPHNTTWQSDSSAHYYGSLVGFAALAPIDRPYRNISLAVYPWGTLHPPPQRQTGRAIGTDDDVVEKPHFDRGQRLLDARGHGAVGDGGLRVARGVVVEGNDRGGIEQQRSFHDLARMDFRVVDGAEEEGLDRQDGVAGIEEDAANSPSDAYRGSRGRAAARSLLRGNDQRAGVI